MKQEMPSFKAVQPQSMPSARPAQGYFSVPFSELCTAWLKRQAVRVKSTTLSTYSYVVDAHLVPFWGAREQMSNDALCDFSLYLRQRGNRTTGGALSQQTVRGILRILESVITYGINACYISNFYFETTRLYAVSEKVPVLNNVQQAQLESLLFDTPDLWSLGVLTTLYTGLRIGELCALQMHDIRLEAGTICVEKTVQRIRRTDGGTARTCVVVGRPKTANAVRTIPVPEFLLSVFQKSAAFQSACKQQDAYFLTGTGIYMEPRLCQYRFARLKNRSNLPDEVTFHTLRHTFATRCVEYGFDIKVLSEILGHASVTTTLDRYVHPDFMRKFENMQRLRPCIGERCS